MYWVFPIFVQASLIFDLLQDNFLVVAPFICCREVCSVVVLVLSGWIWSVETVVCVAVAIVDSFVPGRTQLFGL